MRIGRVKKQGLCRRDEGRVKFRVLYDSSPPNDLTLIGKLTQRHLIPRRTQSLKYRKPVSTPRWQAIVRRFSAPTGKHIDGFTMGRATNESPYFEWQTLDKSQIIERKPEVAIQYVVSLMRAGVVHHAIELVTILVSWSIRSSLGLCLPRTITRVNAIGDLPVNEAGRQRRTNSKRDVIQVQLPTVRYANDVVTRANG